VTHYDTCRFRHLLPWFCDHDRLKRITVITTKLRTFIAHWGDPPRYSRFAHARFGGSRLGWTPDLFPSTGPPLYVLYGALVYRAGLCSGLPHLRLRHLLRLLRRFIHPHYLTTISYCSYVHGCYTLYTTFFGHWLSNLMMTSHFHFGRFWYLHLVVVRAFLGLG